MMRVQCGWLLLVAGLVLVSGCREGVDSIRETGETIRAIKRQTEKRLDELAVRGLMDFELQEDFRRFKIAYQQAAAEGPVVNWDQLASSALQAGLDATAMREVASRGLQPVWGVPVEAIANKSPDVLVAWHPDAGQGKSWCLFADGRFALADPAELAEYQGK